MKPIAGRRLAGAVLACAALLTGCGAHSSPPSGTPRTAAPPAPVATPTPVSVDMSALPIAAYELTPEQSAQESYLSQRLRDTCMRSFGLTDLPDVSTAVISRTVRIDQEFASRLFGVSDAATVATWGYHLPDWTRGAAVGKLPAAETAVLDGTASSYHGRTVPSGGCAGQSERELTRAGIGAATQDGGGGTTATVAGSIEHNGFVAAQTSTPVRRVFAAWSACMAGYGLHYPDPFTAAGDHRWATPSPTPAEIRAARTDITCKLRTNLLGVEFAAVADQENALIARDAAGLRAERARTDSERAAIARLMSAH